MNSRIWVCSDHHFYHSNLLRGQKIGIRPFDTLEEMHEEIINRHNTCVKPTDKVYFLGDITLARNPKVGKLDIVRRLNGRKRLLLGNHDYFTPEQYRAVGFEKIMATRSLGGYILSHVPVHSMQVGPDSRFKGNVHGHLHERVVTMEDYYMEDRYGYDGGFSHTERVAFEVRDPHYINVCLEQTNYAPVALEEVMAR